jgi:LMBR1 domain-containing protein 1
VAISQPQIGGAKMAGIYPWLVLAGAFLALLLMSYIIYHYFTDPAESYFLAMVAVVLSLTNSVLCTLLIPVDIYVISEGDITSESLHVTISQEHMRTAYLSLFSGLLFMAFCVVPYAYFYGEDRREADFDDKLDKTGTNGCINAFRSTAFFIGFILVLLVIGLNFRPGHTESLDHAYKSRVDAVRWVGDLLDVNHNGLNAISFSIACLTLVGVTGWVFYTAYGMAAMPFDWLRGKQSATEQRQDLEENIATIRDKYRQIQTKYAAREDGSLDLSCMKAADRKELNRLQREHKSLMQHNYRLQEIEQKAGAVIPQLLQCLVPFRWMIGISMMFISLMVVCSLLLTLTDRGLHSPCGWSCGYTLKERLIFNPIDEIFLRLSKFFPVDFIILGILVLYIFTASVFGIVGLGIRLLCFNMYTIRSRKSMPEAMLVLCNVMAHILLALCMALLTIAPNYTSFGSQTTSTEDGTPGYCSLMKQDTKVACQVSVISAFFTRIAIAMPLFSVAYYFANWAFIVVFCSVFARCLFCQTRQPYLEAVKECDEEELGLLSFT